MTPPTDRIRSLDVLRGLGILGILAVNAGYFAMPVATQVEPTTLGPLDPQSTEVWAIIHVFFERKFVTLFSMLFGASMLLIGGDGSDPQKSKILNRRLGWLTVFGLLHGIFVWYGDILLCYAISGFIAAQFRAMAPRRLFVIGALLCLGFAGLEAAQSWAGVFAPNTEMEAFLSPAAARAEIVAYTGSLGSVQAANLGNWLILLAATIFFIPATVGLMFIGMGLLKTRVFTAQRGVGLYLLLTLAGGACLALIWWAVGQEVAAGLADKAAHATRLTLNAALAPVMTLGYVGLICLIVKSPLRLLTGPLGAVGQMAFTNYLTQSLIMTGIFYAGRGLGLFGTMTYLELVPVVVGVWLLQLVWSPLWMAAFRYGPFEWIWRSLVMMRPVAFRRVAAKA